MFFLGPCSSQGKLGASGHMRKMFRGLLHRWKNFGLFVCFWFCLFLVGAAKTKLLATIPGAGKLTNQIFRGFSFADSGNWKAEVVVTGSYLRLTLSSEPRNMFCVCFFQASGQAQGPWGPNDAGSFGRFPPLAFESVRIEAKNQEVPRKLSTAPSFSVAQCTSRSSAAAVCEDHVS